MVDIHNLAFDRSRLDRQSNRRQLSDKPAVIGPSNQMVLAADVIQVEADPRVGQIAQAGVGVVIAQGLIDDHLHFLLVYLGLTGLEYLG